MSLFIVISINQTAMNYLKNSRILTEKLKITSKIVRYLVYSIVYLEVILVIFWFDIIEYFSIDFNVCWSII